LVLHPPAGSAAQDRGPTISVHAADLDLATRDGRRALERRVADAARGACRELAVGSPFDWGAMANCERRMLAEARRIAKLAAAHAQRPSLLARSARTR
ncbi:MAG TPA: UrcA family protein, partial [Allosphingosinicella sp.]|nr:UrcA family protein [Allosphingosinicella sp.]